MERLPYHAVMVEAATIEAWVNGGGKLITEFSATDLLFNGTFGLLSPHKVKKRISLARLSEV